MNNDHPQLSSDAIQRYTTRRTQDLATCKQAWSQGDWATLETIGHRLKGSAGSFGFPELGDLGEKIELAAQRKDRASLEATIRSFEEWVQENPVSLVAAGR